LNTFMPRAGDSEEAVLLKRDMRRKMADAIQNVAEGVQAKEAIGDERAAQQLRDEYAAARDNLMDYVDNQTSTLNGVNPSVAQGIRSKGAAGAESIKTPSAVSAIPGFSGRVDPATGLPVFNQSPTVTAVAPVARPETVGYVSPSARQAINVQAR
jgi:hypothetical protein